MFARPVSRGRRGTVTPSHSQRAVEAALIAGSAAQARLWLPGADRPRLASLPSSAMAAVAAAAALPLEDTVGAAGG